MSPGGAMSQIRASATPSWASNPRTIRLSTVSTERASATASATDWSACGCPDGPRLHEISLSRGEIS